MTAVIAAAAGLWACSASKGSYYVDGIERSRIVIDSRYDKKPDKDAMTFIAPYTARVDSVMSPVVGRSARYMEVHRPESELSNLLADILMWASSYYGERPVFAVYNMGGIRAPLPEGTVTYGDILRIAPFENKICFLTLSGKYVLKLFENIAFVGGQGVSRGVELVIKDRKLVSARLNGEEIDPARNYRIVTIDYLAEANDQMEAFKKKNEYKSTRNEEDDMRNIIAKYFRAMEKRGEAVDARTEGRITIGE